MNLNLKSKLILFILFPLIVFFTILYFLLLPSIKLNSKEASQIISSKTANYYSSNLNNKFSSDIDILKILKISFENYKLDDANADLFQKDLLKFQIINKPDISSAWFLYEDGDYNKFKQYLHVDNEIKYKNRTLSSGDYYSEIYRSIKNNPKEVDLYIPKPKEFKKNGILSFSIVTQIFLNNEIAGILGFDFTTKEMINGLKAFSNIENTNLMLLYNNELFDLKYSISDSEINKADLEEYILSSTGKLNKSIIYNNTLNNKKYIIRIKPVDVKTKTDKLSLVVIEETDDFGGIFKTINSRYILVVFISLLTIFLVILYLSNFHTKRLNITNSVLKAMAAGEVNEIKELDTSNNDNISNINNSINTINKSLDKTAKFIGEIASGNLDFEYKALTKNDTIGNSLIQLRKNLEQAKKQELERKEEDKRQSWATIGTAKFSEIIREHSDNLEDLAYAIISDLVNYIGANQGGLFVINEDDENKKYIELLASYAFSRRKMLTKKIPWGVGLVGRCIQEKETIFMTKIPEKYLSISSGLGEENPASLLIVPLIFHEEVFGVVELASFTGIEQYKIDLVEHISESIASAISMVKINVRTAELLRESKIKTEQTASQEEEIRQNIEEMQAATDELNGKLEDAKNIFTAVNSVANIAQFDMNGRIIDISKNFLDLLKKDKKDIIGKVQGSFSSEAKNPESFKHFWDELKKGNKMEFEQVLKINDELIRLNSIYIPLKNSAGEYYKVVSFASKK